jgi:hypothetical protein
VVVVVVEGGALLRSWPLPQSGLLSTAALPIRALNCETNIHIHGQLLEVPIRRMAVMLTLLDAAPVADCLSSPGAAPWPVQ